MKELGYASNNRRNKVYTKKHINIPLLLRIFLQILIFLFTASMRGCYALIISKINKQTMHTTQ